METLIIAELLVALAHLLLKACTGKGKLGSREIAKLGIALGWSPNIESICNGDVSYYTAQDALEHALLHGVRASDSPGQYTIMCGQTKTTLLPGEGWGMIIRCIADSGKKK